MDRDLVALLFSGLVRNGPGGTIVPDLAERWSVDKTGKTWTVDLRDDARWHDGQPVTADDVLFTIRTLQDPAYTGPSSTSWSEVSVTSSGPRRVVFSLQTPLGGFLQALTQPLAPAHLMADIPIDLLGEDPFGRAAGRIGAVRARGADRHVGVARSGRRHRGRRRGIHARTVAVRHHRLAGDPGTDRSDRRDRTPYLSGIEFRFYTDPEQLAADFRAGSLDSVSGISRQLAAELGTQARHAPPALSRARR